MKRVLILCLLCLLAACNAFDDVQVEQVESYMTEIPGRVPHRTRIEFGKIKEARVGETFLRAATCDVYKPYSPREEMAVTGPGGSALGLEPDQVWRATHMIADSDILLKAPGHLSPGGYELALRVNSKGTVVGDRPWFDLKSHRRFLQGKWVGEKRLFKVSPSEPKEPKEVTARYDKFAGCKEEIGKCFGSITIAVGEVGKEVGGYPGFIVDNGDVIQLGDAQLEVLGFTPQVFTYVIREKR